MDKVSRTELFDLTGRTALVTGGTRGLGRAMARVLLENGCDVLVTARRIPDLPELEEAASRTGRRLLARPCDITDTAAVAKLMAAAEAELGRLDILVNAAGMNEPKLLEDMDDATWDRILDLNLRAAFVVTREAVRIMRRRRYGKIVHISSVKGFLGVSDAGYSAYCASKGAINMLTRQVACEVAADGITVNAIAPTFIKTDINARQLEDPVFYKSLTDRIPVGRIGTFQDLAGLLLLLTSDASQFITGQTILLDGGLTARQ